MHPSSIAILRLGALGDVCLTVPLVRLLQEELPNTVIYWIISRICYPLVADLPGVQFIVIDPPHSLKTYSECYRLLKPFHFDALLMPQATWRTNLLSLLIKAPEKYGYDRLHSRDYQRFFVTHTVKSEPEHLLDSFLRFSEAFGITPKNIDGLLPIPAKDEQWASQLLDSQPGKWVAICLSSSKAERNWPVDRYVELLQRLSLVWAFNVVLIGAADPYAEKASAYVQQQCPCPCLNLIAQTSLKQLTALLAQVDLLLAPDSGPVHIATSFHTPVVGLYAVAPMEKTGPYRSSKWSVNEFPTAARAFLKKKAREHWHARIHSKEAMALITVSAVQQQLEALFSELGFQKLSA